MGIINGSGSITRYWVEEALPTEFMEELAERLIRHAFRPLDETSPDESTRGWVNIMNVLDYRFPAMDYLKEPYLALAYRVDKRKIPAMALKQACLDAEEKVKELEKVEFLPKAVKMDIKEDVKARLLKRSIPDTRTYDMIWNLSTGLVIFGGVNDKLCDDFSEYFLKTFDLHLIPEYPYGMALKILEKDNVEAEVLDGLIATR